MLQETHAAEIEELLERFEDRHSVILPLLYLAQDTYGTLTTDVIREVAETLDVPFTAVFEVVGFYTLYYDIPIGKWVIQVCDDVPCCYLGAEELIDGIKHKLQIQEDGTTDDGMFTLQRVKCLATCQRPPVVQCNLSYFYDVTVERLDALLKHLREHADSAEASSVSGRYAEDYEPGPDGTFRLIQRKLTELPAASSATPSAQTAQQVATNGQEASVPTEPAQARAAKKAEKASPVDSSPDQSPASAHPEPDQSPEKGAVPPTAAQDKPPEEKKKSEE